MARDPARNPYSKGHEVAGAIADWQQEKLRIRTKHTETGKSN